MPIHQSMNGGRETRAQTKLAFAAFCCFLVSCGNVLSSLSFQRSSSHQDQSRHPSLPPSLPPSPKQAHASFLVQ